MILCLSFARGMVDMCIPGMFPVLGQRACCHCTCEEIGNKKQTLPVSAANGPPQGVQQGGIHSGRPGVSLPEFLPSRTVFVRSMMAEMLENTGVSIFWSAKERAKRAMLA